MCRAFNLNPNEGELPWTEITTVGVDLAKEVIVVCAADARGRTLYFKQLSFAAFAAWAANLPPCVIGMEACSSAHHWARALALHGHTPTPDGRRARGAVSHEPRRPRTIATTPRRSLWRWCSRTCALSPRSLSTSRRCCPGIGREPGSCEERTSLLNRTRGLLAEFGIWIGRSSGGADAAAAGAGRR